MANPFTIVFGRKPTEMIERFLQRHEILDNFTSPNANQQLYMITGIRGSGKTVLMTSVSDTLQQEKDWIVIDLNPEMDLRSPYKKGSGTVPPPRMVLGLFTGNSPVQTWTC